ncbi:hypothetical protein ACW6QP_11710 [Salegentibacter sp. HM20]
MKLYKNLVTEFEEMSLGYSTIGIIASSCLGSIAAMFILMKGHGLVNMLELFLVVVVCMGFNAAVLAQFKPKVIFNSLLISLAVSVLLIAINLV